ncbi:MAG: T9SS type A sorting domain-containing protein [Bernardetiaceae bacterium]|nr:T9SS type A sorting domain-containing protein [Bernardetiaceae bacterium]
MLKKYVSLSLFLLLIFAYPAEAQQANGQLLSDQWQHRFEQVKQECRDGKRRSITPLLMQAAFQDKNDRSPEVNQIMEAFEDRPDYLSEFYDTPNFRFHYDTRGEDAVDPTDNDRNGIPDYIDQMAESFEFSFNKQINEMGYVKPPSDGNAGGSPAYDVYVYAIGDFYGFVMPETIVGNNPNSPERETSAATSWMGMRNNYRGFPGTELESIQVTAAHEYHHSIQMGYKADLRGEDPSVFIAEATAVWMEDKVYPGIDDNFQYLPEIFLAPDVALNLNYRDERAPEFDEFENYWYGTWILSQYLDERYGEVVLRRMWENMRNQDEMVALRAALQAQGVKLEDAYHDFLVANLLLFNNTSNSTFSYRRGADYAAALSRDRINTMRIEGRLNFSGQNVTWRSDADGNRRLMRLGADYFSVNTSNNFRATLSPMGGGSSMSLQVVVFNNNTRAARRLQRDVTGGSAAIDVTLAAGETAFLIVARPEFATTSAASAQYTITLSNSEGGDDDGGGDGNVTGLDRLADSESLTIGPNPASNVLQIFYALQGQNIQFVMTDMLGREVWKSVAHSPEGTIEAQVNHLPSGTYLLSAYKDGAAVAVRKALIVK